MNVYFAFFVTFKDPYSRAGEIKTIYITLRYSLYCMEGIKMRQLVLGPQTFIVKYLIIQNTHLHYFYTQTERRGHRQTARETEIESVRENERCGKTSVGVRHKTGHWKNPLTSFWDKLGRINFFWETILMEERDRKDTLRLNILRDTLGDNWYDDMSHILHNYMRIKYRYAISWCICQRKPL
jgi:hypothetical protein